MTVNLLDLDAAGLAGFFAELGEKPFRARQVLKWIHQSRRGRFRRDDRPRQEPAREARRRGARSTRRAVVGDTLPPTARASGCSKVDSGQRDRDGVHPGDQPRHAVHLEPGRLRARLRVLLDRQAGLQPQPVDRRDHRPAVAAPTTLLARKARRTSEARIISNVVMMGMGEPMLNLDNVDPGAAPDARRQRLRPVAPARHGVDRRAWCPAWTGCATSARWRSPSRCTRPTTSCATGWCRSTANIRCAT